VKPLNSLLRFGVEDWGLKMEYLVGAILAFAVAGAARIIGLDRGRAFYATVLIVVASYYALFAVMGASRTILEIEIAVGVGFSLLAVLGFRRNMWLVAVAIAGHGVFDLLHHLFIENSGVPMWWPGFCATVDLILGGWLAICLLNGTLYGSECNKAA
jgi:hypothetical protein